MRASTPDTGAPDDAARIIRGLGVSTSISGALTAPPSRPTWARKVANELLRSAIHLLRSAKRLVRGPDDRVELILSASYDIGRWMGAARVTSLLIRGKCDFFGRAYYAGHVDGADRVVRAD